MEVKSAAGENTIFSRGKRATAGAPFCSLEKKKCNSGLETESWDWLIQINW
jgi:hypothetical protein